MWTRRTFPALIATLTLLAGAGCAVDLSRSSGGGSRAPEPEPGRQPAPTAARRADPQDVQRISRALVPLLGAADRKYQLDQVRVGIVADDSINAANAGNGQFFVTRGLLDRASDEQLLAVLAHEVAHDDLGHVAKAQLAEAGVGVGAAILGQIFPIAQSIAPIAGTLITRAYSRSEELAADRHGAELLERVGSSKSALERTLEWLKSTPGGNSPGGFLSTHPAIDDRIEALRAMR
jgi:Zn-dependent protease with chaperone function